jgi:ADP-ribose pyrophosphatase
MDLISKLEILKEELKVVNIEEINSNNSFLDIKTYQVTLNNGHSFKREKLLKGTHDGSAVVVVPITIDNKSIVIVQPRVLTSTGIGIEVPAGYIDKCETESDAALRELREETGYVPDELIKLKSYYQDQGISSAYNTCFLALGCKREYEQDLDKDEYIKYLECNFDDLVYLVDEGIINDANSIIAINESKKYLRK